MFDFLSAGRGLRAAMLARDADHWEARADGGAVLYRAGDEVARLSRDEIAAGEDALFADLRTAAGDVPAALIERHPRAEQTLSLMLRDAVEIAVTRDEEIPTRDELRRLAVALVSDRAPEMAR